MAGTLPALKILAAMLLPLACIWFADVDTVPLNIGRYRSL
jgi:hypothetical protein